MNLEPVIGLEIHVQLATRTRLFSYCPRVVHATEPPNRVTDPVALGLPGTLPVLNRAAVERALLLAVVFDAEIARESRFDRKHYFYPDLPRNYQITQVTAPLMRGGRLRFEFDGAVHEVRLERAHLEEDAARSVHRDGRTFVDFNRAGTALLEVVTAPELASPRQAAAALGSLREIVRWFGVSEGDLEEGHLRCDANVSLREPGGRGGERVELKNLNSIRGVARALHAEIERQRRAIETGTPVAAETRGWDEVRGRSFGQRTKEDTVDYRFLPEPDLGPLVVDEQMIGAAREAVGESPIEVRARWRRSGMAAEAAQVLGQDRARARWCDAVLAAGAPADELGRWASGELLRRARERRCDLPDLPWPVEDLAALLSETASGIRSVAEARELLDRSSGHDLGALRRASPPGPAVSEAALRDLLARHPDEVAHYRAGKIGLLGWFVARYRVEHPEVHDLAEVSRLLRLLLSGNEE